MADQGSDFLGGLGVSVVQGAMAAGDSRRERQFARDEAFKARKWAEGQSATAVRRRVADMRLAGINPMIAFAGSGGSAAAQTPTGASATSSRGNIAGAVESGVSTMSAIGQRRLEHTRNQNLNKQGELLDAQRSRENSTSALNAELRSKAHSDGRKAESDIFRNNAEIGRTNMDTRLMQRQDAGLKVEEDIDKSWVGKATRRAQRVIGVITGAKSSAKAVRGR